MTTPQEKLEAARAELTRLEREVGQMTCHERGSHRWEHYGNKNACCNGEGHCGCSAPVYVCKDCGDCDYGENAERDEIVLECARLNG